mgnify:CR=1 FL=1
MSPAPSRSADRPATHGRVLVVDDEPEMRRMICAALRSQGWETLEAATMEEVMGALEADAPTAVTLDVNLRGESGYDVCRRIREMSDVPILFLTGHGDVPWEDSFRALEAIGYKGPISVVIQVIGIYFHRPPMLRMS